MRVYLDTSVLNRIFDDQSQPRIYLESSSVLIVFMLIDSGAAQFVTSDVLLFENGNNPYEERREFVSLCVQKADEILSLDEGILARAEELESQGLKGIDALHIACAEKLAVEYFLTCDDNMIKRYRGSLKVQNPADFVMARLRKEDQ